MKTHIQLIFSTIALTALIWFYADRIGRDYYTASVPVKFTTGDPSGSAVLRVVGAREDAQDVKLLEMSFQGPKSAIRHLETEDAADSLQLKVKITDHLSSGRQARDIFADLSHLPEISNRGLVLQSVSPQVVEFDIDRYSNVEVDIQFVAGVFENELNGKPIAKPAKVMARVLESNLMEGALPPLQVFIEDYIKEEIRSEDEQIGGECTFDVPLQSTWSGIKATFIPEEIQVSVKLKRRMVRERKTLIPLGIRVAPRDLRSFEITWQDEATSLMQVVDVLVPIEKQGPFKELEPRDIEAYVNINYEDLQGSGQQAGWIERQVRFVFPPGFQDVKVVGEPPTVKFRITKIATEESSPPLAGP